MFLLFQIPAFACGPSDPEMERAMWPAWQDPWTFGGFVDVNRDPGMEGRFEWRPQRIISLEEMAL